MSKQKQKSKLKEKSHRIVKSNLIIGSIIATIIATVPYLFYLYNSVPQQKVWNTIFFTYESTYYEDVNWVAWIFVGKAIPLLLLLIWFLTCRHWWYHVLLVPIAMYIYQIAGLFNDDYKHIDEFQLIHLIPIMIIIIPSIYLIRAQMFNRVTNVDKTMQELEEEFKIKPKSFLDKLSDYF